MSTAEEDISALLDEMEMENYVSFLQDDSVFQELNKLDLPAVDHQIGEDRFLTNDPMEFHDALDYFYKGSGFNPSHIEAAPCLNQLSDQVLQGLLNTAEYDTTLPTHTYPTLNGSDHPSDNGCGLTMTNDDCQRPALLTCIEHDHTYAHSVGTDTDTSVLATPPNSSSSLSLNNGKEGASSDSDEGSTSDTGYDTNGTSPASTRSSFSSVKEPLLSVIPTKVSPTHSMATPPHQQPIDENFSKLLVDPVKLIDDRIKFFMNHHDEVHLTEEEKNTLRSEGLPIPTTLPLTKTEEKALKSVRRKIRNKIAAQESRKKKKQYVHCLEEKVQQCTQENRLLHKKVHSLESENKTLLQQLTQLQLLVARASPILGKQVNMGACLMVVVLCFGVLFGNLIPYSVSVDTASNTYSTAAVRSRSLLSMESSSHWLKWPSYLSMLSPGYSNHAYYQHATPTNAIKTLYYSNNVTLCSS